jgi:hypothetical protein
MNISGCMETSATIRAINIWIFPGPPNAAKAGVETKWIAGERVGWGTGLPDGRPELSSGRGRKPATPPRHWNSRLSEGAITVDQADESGRVVQVRRIENENRMGWSVELFFVALDDDMGAAQQVRKEYQLGPNVNVDVLTKLSAGNVRALGLTRGQVLKA